MSKNEQWGVPVEGWRRAADILSEKIEGLCGEVMALRGVLLRVNEGAKDDRAALVALGSTAAELRTAINDLRCSIASIGGAVNECVTLLRGVRAVMEADRAAPAVDLPAARQAALAKAAIERAGAQRAGRPKPDGHRGPRVGEPPSGTVVMLNGEICHLQPFNSNTDVGIPAYWSDTPWGRMWFSADAVAAFRRVDANGLPAKPGAPVDGLSERGA
jgi:hypothetical protein